MDVGYTVVSIKGRIINIRHEAQYAICVVCSGNIKMLYFEGIFRLFAEMSEEQQETVDYTKYACCIEELGIMKVKIG